MDPLPHFENDSILEFQNSLLGKFFHTRQQQLRGRTTNYYSTSSIAHGRLFLIDDL